MCHAYPQCNDQSNGALLTAQVDAGHRDGTTGSILLLSWTSSETSRPCSIRIFTIVAFTGIDDAVSHFSYVSMAARRAGSKAASPPFRPSDTFSTASGTPRLKL